MKPTIENLQDSFFIGYSNYRESREEAAEIWDFYHNRQYTAKHISILQNRGQPKETFNVIKMFSRMYLGYLTSVINEIKVQPKQQNDIYTAAILNDLVTYVLQQNNFESMANNIKLDGILTGLMCVYEDVRQTGETDEFGRPLFEVVLEHIPSQEIILDPHSRLEDYSDAKFIHRFKWISEEDFINNFGKAKLDEVEANTNTTPAPEADLSRTFKGGFSGKFKQFNNYLVIHSIVKDYDKKRGNISYSVFWCGNVILDKKEVTYNKVKFPYRVQKINYSNETEYYGLFREVIETQKAINQALVKIQTLANTRLIFVQPTAVENLQNFTDDVGRISAVIPVLDLNGIKIENNTRDIIDQYNIIDKAMERIKSLLSINDSFLGLAPASDSGVKVQIQQNASVVALNYLTVYIKNFYKLLGKDIITLIQQFFTATQTLSIVDETYGQKFFEINTPMQRYHNGQPMFDEYGNPIYLMEEVIDPKTGEVMEDPEGRILMQPVPTEESEIQFTDADIIVESVAYNDTLAVNNQIMHDLLNGNMGQFLMQTYPAGYAKAAALALQNLKAPVSPSLADIFNEASLAISQQQQMIEQQQAQQQAIIPY